MSKLDKEFKDEINQEFRVSDYVFKKIAIRVLAIILVVGIFSSVGGFAYKRIKIDQDRKAFKNSVTYMESAVSFLADRYQECNKAETAAEKTAIMKYVVMRYPNLDVDDIENTTLKQFYTKCLIGG